MGQHFNFVIAMEVNFLPLNDFSLIVSPAEGQAAEEGI